MNSRFRDYDPLSDCFGEKVRQAQAVVAHELTHADQFFPREMSRFLPDLDDIIFRIRRIVRQVLDEETHKSGFPQSIEGWEERQKIIAESTTRLAAVEIPFLHRNLLQEGFPMSEMFLESHRIRAGMIYCNHA